MSFDRELLSSALPAYDIGGELGQGGMGVVVAGQHRRLDRRVAIKQLPVAFAEDPSVQRRFMAEARVLASLDHPHVVPVYDFVEHEGVCLLVMELLPGGTLRSRVAAAGGFTAPHAVAVSLACMSGLSAAHRRGVLHRDIKPENMLFSASGVLKVTDFGIAKVIGGTGTVLTRAGDVIGTPAYIAPEQVRGGPISPATDVYGVATMLYELIASTFPFDDNGEAMALLFKHAYEAPIPLRDVVPGVPEPVAAVVMRGLATDPTGRFATAESFGAALAQAGTQAWGPGWLQAEQVPIMDAGPIVGASGQPSVPPPAAPTVAPGAVLPTVAPGAGPPTVGPGGAMPAAPGGAGPAAPTLAPGEAAPTLGPGGPLATAGEREPAPAHQGAGIAVAVPASPDAARRRRLITAVVVAAIIVIAILAVLVLPKLFHVYGS
jgi:hypothetical protein